MRISNHANAFSVLIVCFVLLAITPSIRAAEEATDWWQAERDVTTALTQPDADLAALVKQFGAMRPANAQQALMRLSVFTRAGMTQEAIQAVRDLKRLRPDLPGHVLSNVYHEIVDHRQAWEVAQALVEIFADNASGLTLENRLLQHFLDTGWSVDRVDQWLADKPRGAGDFWIKERLRFNQKHGRGAAFERELANQVRANPADVTKAIAYLDALSGSSRDAATLNLDWLAETVKPGSASDAHEIASRLKNLGDVKNAIVLYRRAMAMPYTAEEVRRRNQWAQVTVSDAISRAYFAVQLREELAQCLLQIGQAAEAQKWMLEATDLRTEHRLGRNAQFAGQVQAASGRRDVEGRIRAEEKVAADSPEYWRERAEYYRGRSDAVQEEKAIQKGLVLTVPRPPEAGGRKGNADWRSQLLGDYARFLLRQNRAAEAVALLRKELAEAPVDSVSAAQSARLLAFDFENQIRVDEPVLWTWLEKRPKWEHTEERLMWRMLQRAKRDELEQYFVRAEKLALSGDASRAHALGWIENRMQFPQRSVALLDYAIANAADEDLKQKASFTLFESCLDIRDWQRAESVWPVANRQLTSWEFPEWYAKVALTAAQAGAKADAMRIWIRAANVDLTATRPVDELIRAGLRDELSAFYQEIQRTIPSSEIPSKLLAKLQKQ